MVDSLLNVNNMNYSMPAMPSIAVSRTVIDVFPQVTSASAGGNVIFNISTGDQFVNPAGSYLELKLTVNDSSATNKLGNASYLWNNVVLTARNGVEICRVNDFPMFVKKQRWQMTHDKFQLLKDSEAEELSLTAPVAPATSTEYGFIMRLDTIPFFQGKNLLPSQIMEGLRLQFSVNSVQRAFHGAGAISGFSVVPVLKLDCVTLADAFLRRVSELSANQGLVLMHNEAFPAQSDSTTTAFNANINKACSKATEYVVFSRDSANVVSATADSYQPEVYKFNTVQIQAGAQYYPRMALTQSGPGEHTSKGAYHYVLTNMAPNYNCSIRYENFYDETKANFSLFGQNLRESNSSMSGILLNNSRSLIVNATMSDALASGRIFNSYLSHIRLVRVFSNNVVVRD
jgi:hypothetical protein